MFDHNDDPGISAEDNGTSHNSAKDQLRWFNTKARCREWPRAAKFAGLDCSTILLHVNSRSCFVGVKSKSRPNQDLLMVRLETNPRPRPLQPEDQFLRILRRA